MYKRKLAAVASAVTLFLALAACSSTTGSTQSSGAASASGSGSTTIGALWPPAITAARWVDQDPVYFKAKVQALDSGLTVIAGNAPASDNAGALALVQGFITKGAKVLLVDPPTSNGGVAIVAAAHKENIPVISYDALIPGPNIAFYTTFDPIQVGYLQGQYLVDNLPKGSSVAIINGQPDQDIAQQFKQGVHKALDPAFASGQLKSVYEVDTPNWDPANAKDEMTQALTKTNNNIQGVVASNDGMAGGVVAALTAQSLDGKVLVTGQDGTLAGLQRVLLGTQSMTVFKSAKVQAEAAASVAVALAQGKSDAISSVATSKVNNGTIDVPTLLLKPDVIIKTSVGQAVTAGLFTWDQICNGIPASACPSH